MRRVWAVARETYLECLRTRVMMVFTGLLAVCLVGMGLSVGGDGTLKGRIQTFLAYGTGLTQLLLSLLTIFLATRVVAQDIRSKTIFTVAAKPLPRWQYVLGRWAGVALLDALLLGVATVSIYGLAQYLRATPTMVEKAKASNQAAEDAPDADRRSVESEVFTARAEHRAEPFQVGDQIEQRMQQLRRENDLEELIRNRIGIEIKSEQKRRGLEAPVEEQDIQRRLADTRTRDRIVRQIEAEMRKRIIEERQLIRPGKALKLTFTGLDPPRGREEPIQIRYRLRPLNIPESRTVKSWWRLYNPETGLEKFLPHEDSAESVSSFTFSPDFVTSEGGLTVFYVNPLDPAWPTTVKLRPEEATVLYRVGSFEGNLARGAVLILLRLMFLAAVGVLLGVFLSFPVACLVCLIIFGVGALSGFVLDATRFLPNQTPTAMDYFSHYVARIVFFFLPSFARTSPTDSLVLGKHIPWSLLGMEATAGTGLRIVLSLAIGWLIFRRREVAKVQV